MLQDIDLEWTAGYVQSASGKLLLPGMLLCPPVTYAPGSQTSLTVTSTALAAFSSANVNTGSFTAPPSGSVLAEASFSAKVSTVTSTPVYVAGLCAHGTTTPAVGTTVSFQESTANVTRPYLLRFPVTGLTPGTSYNLDLMGACATASDSVIIVAFGQSAVTPSGSTGGPVVMTVRAV